jgi:hypothetical protein
MSADVQKMIRRHVAACCVVTLWCTLEFGVGRPLTQVPSIRGIHVTSYSLFSCPRMLRILPMLHPRRPFVNSSVIHVCHCGKHLLTLLNHCTYRSGKCLAWRGETTRRSKFWAGAKDPFARRVSKPRFSMKLVRDRARHRSVAPMDIRQVVEYNGCSIQHSSHCIR